MARRADHLDPAQARTRWLLPRAIWRDKWLLMAAWILVGAVRLSITVRGFRNAPALCRDSMALPLASPALSRRVEWAIYAASRLVPRATCLIQARAGQRLLAWRGCGSEIIVGARRGEDGALKAHAWLVSGDLLVLGGRQEDLARFQPLLGVQA